MLLPAHNLHSDIAKLLAYFDLFEYPLTSLEIWQFLPIKCSYQTVQQALEQPNKNWHSHQGLYYLVNQEKHLFTKQQRYNISDHKFKRAKKIAWLFAWLPWIKLICLANNIGHHNLRAQGDIDLFIVTQKNRLWVTRLFTVGLTKLLLIRPTAKKMQDTICLSFLIDDSDLNLEVFLLNQATDNPDRYFTYWLASLQPIYDTNNYYQQLIKQNKWLANYLPNWQTTIHNYRRFINKTKPKLWHIIIEKILGWLENLAKKFQYKVMAETIKNSMNKNSQVVVNDHVLKLHTEDRRQLFHEKYLNNLKQLKNLTN